jgi:uncharacterized membrane-anchored protein
MDTLGKGLFWLGFIVLIGVVFAYLIMMIAGSIAFATTTAVLSICAVILIGALLMIMGRGYERRAERKRDRELSQPHTTK